MSSGVCRRNQSCIYKKTVLKEVNGVMKEHHALIALYVDDLIIAFYNVRGATY